MRAAIKDLLIPHLGEWAAKERMDARPTLQQILRRVRLRAIKVFEPDVPRRVGRRVAEQATRETAKQLGLEVPRIPVFSEQAISPMVEDFVTANVSLVTNMADEALQEIEVVVNSAAREGLRASEIAEQIKERLDVSDSRAQLIARDQVLTLNADVSRARMEAVGVTRYRWSTSRDERVRKGHADLNGQIFSFDDPPVTDERTGETANPGEDINCRCVAIPVFDLEE
jgi:SPP1 gp7 family putative phage head morphogenesis protein